MSPLLNLVNKFYSSTQVSKPQIVFVLGGPGAGKGT